MNSTSKTSSYCADSACVEIDNFSFPEKIIVRDSDGNECYFSKQEWAAFILGVKNDEFDF